MSSKSLTPVMRHGKLSVKPCAGYNQPVLTDKYGKCVILKGISSHGLQWDAGNSFVNYGAYKTLRDDFNADLVRVAAYVTQDGYIEGNREIIDKKIEEAVEYAVELGLYIIIDWHIHNETVYDTLGKERFSESKKFFKKYANKYKNLDNIIFEICNEPVGVNWYNDGAGNDLYTYCKEIVSIIREEGSDAVISCGTDFFSQNIQDVHKKFLSEDGFDNIMYTLHFYAGSHGDEKYKVNLFKNLSEAIRYKTPIFVTEYGICDESGNTNIDIKNADRWIDLLRENGISYCMWSLTNIDESASILKPYVSRYDGKWDESDLSATGIWVKRKYEGET